jgi:penicillin amidase
VTGRRRIFVAAVVLAALACVVAATVAGSYVYLRRSLPQLEGTISVPGLSQAVDIVRDADAVTHVLAATKRDALYGLGYAHAQDRLWQMEFQRRAAFGRLSEVLGSRTVPGDRFFVTLGLGRAARSAWTTLPADTQTEINAYVAGINAFLAAHHGSRLPIEFTLARFEPEPWSGSDVIASVKMMAWDLSRNYPLEVLRHDVTARLGVARAAQLFPPYPASGLTVLTDSDMPWSVRVGRTVAAPVASSAAGTPAPEAASWSDGFSSTRPRPVTSVVGANAWVVDGTMTASGKPMLAADVHFETQTPSHWYLAHLTAGDFDVIGATVPGIPAVILGRNRFIAWADTNLAADTQDLYHERIDRSGRLAEFLGAQEPMQIVRETLAVKGAPSIALEVRITRHGPLMSDAMAMRDPVALRWTGIDAGDTSVVALLRVNEARNWTEFTAALRHLVAPARDYVYADVDGHIGYYASGRVPVRQSGDGSSASEGWSGLAEWTGWIPFDELPHTFDPPEHFVISANNRVTPSSYPHALAGDWADPYRARRLGERLTQSMLTVDAAGEIQTDVRSLHAATLLPLMLDHVIADNEQDDRALTMVKTWKFDARGDIAAAAIFEAWYYELLPAIAGDELAGALIASYRDHDNSSYASRFLVHTLEADNSPWCDDVRTPKTETCDDTVLAALHAGLARLTAGLGPDMTLWRWDGVHKVIFTHAVLDGVPLVGSRLRRTVPGGGDWSTINAGPVSVSTPFEQAAVAGYRQTVDLSPGNDSRFIDALGQSAHILSPRYRDGLLDWSHGRGRKMRIDRAEVERNVAGRLRLLPR